MSRGVVLSFNSPLFEKLNLPKPDEVKFTKIPDGHVQCSFCPAIVPIHRATFGSTARRLRKVLQIVGPITLPGGALTYETKTKHRPSNGVACPDHALLIVPIEDKDGDIISSGQKWPDYE